MKVHNIREKPPQLNVHIQGTTTSQEPTRGQTKKLRLKNTVKSPLENKATEKANIVD